MLTPKDYIGALMELAQDRRGEFKEIKFITENRASIIYELPLAEVSPCEADKQLALTLIGSVHSIQRCCTFHETCMVHCVDGGGLL